MKKSKIFQLALLLSLPVSSYSQTPDPGSPEMADLMRSNGKIYVVVTVVSIVFTGIIVFMLMLDRKIRRLEERRSK